MKETKNLKNKNGITLIALVITIIVMLILVALTITIAINGGLFNYAGKATVDTKNAVNAEQELANGRIKIGDKWYDSIGDYLNNIPSTNQGKGGNEKNNVFKEIEDKYILSGYYNEETHKMEDIHLNFLKNIELKGKIFEVLTDEEVVYYRYKYELKINAENFENMVEECYNNGLISEKCTTAKEFLHLLNLHNALSTDSMREDLKDYGYENVDELTDEEVLARYFNDEGPEHVQSFEWWMEKLYTEGVIKKQYTSFQEYAIGELIWTDEEIEDRLRNIRGELSIRVYDSKGGMLSDELTYDGGMGNYTYIVKINGVDFCDFTISIDQYEIILCEYSLRVYDFQNQKFLEINEIISAEQCERYWQSEPRGYYWTDWEKLEITNEQILTDEYGSYISDSAFGGYEKSNSINSIELLCGDMTIKGFCTWSYAE